MVMKYVYSTSNSLTELTVSTAGDCVYLGFSGNPAPCVFSQKITDSVYHSTSEYLLGHLDQLIDDGNRVSTVFLHTVNQTVTLDIATAAWMLLAKNRVYLEQPEWLFLMKYIGDIERGVAFSSFSESLYAFYYATAHLCRSRHPSGDHNSELMDGYHQALTEVLKKPGLDQDFPHRFMHHLADNFDFSAQTEFLRHEEGLYTQFDYAESKKIWVRLPLKHSPAQKYARVRGLVVENPRSTLLKFFARNKRRYIEDNTVKNFPLLYVFYSASDDRRSRHVISVPPDVHYSLKGFSERVEKKETEKRQQHMLPARQCDNPRPGYRYNDPWYDERHAGYSIIDTPREGSLLTKQDMIDLLCGFMNP